MKTQLDSSQPDTTTARDDSRDKSNWNIASSRELYNIARWGQGYFDVNEMGHVAVRPGRDGQGEVDLFELAADLARTGLSLPILVRFTNILQDRVDSLCGAFSKAIEAKDYKGRHTAVYPIKVNQQRSVVREIQAHGGDRVGLEAGSKPELMVVTALSDAKRKGVVVCNGYKDRQYIRLALIGHQLGLNVYIVIEKLSELELIVAESRRLGVSPQLGLRVRLASIGAGKWQNTGGEKSKFGLSAVQSLEAIERLRNAGMLDSLVLLHCHMGSQISNVRDIQCGMRELARYYSELVGLGIPIGVIDVGGGLGVDYEGTGSRGFSSINYSLQEYANTVVHTIWEICSQLELPHPDIFTECGRAMSAHHAVLITNVVDYESAPSNTEPTAPIASEPLILGNLWEVYNDDMSRRSPVEAYHDAVHWLAEAQSMYTHGVLDVQQRARAEQLYYAICHRIHTHLKGTARAHREVLDELKDKLADKYFCNFSLFQSVPDVWAIQQIFPILPLHRLDECPSRRGTLQDLTCDSDGRIEQFVGSDGIESTLPLHPWRQDEPYLVGIFLVGAYQEILGDMHNMFGDTHSVNVELTDNGDYRVVDPILGDTVRDLLRYVHFEPDDLIKAFSAKIAAIDLDAEQRHSFLAELKAGLSDYTYLAD